jgi:DNA-binding MarR family transcriptional regulator
LSSLAIKSRNNYFWFGGDDGLTTIWRNIMALAKKNAPADPGEANKLDDFLCFAVYSTNLAVQRLQKPVLDELGLTYLQYIVLVVLYEQDDQTVGGLGDKLFLDSSTLTPLLKRLETMGHLTRERDPQDERQVRLRLTPQGRSARERALDYRSELVGAMGLDAAGFQRLREDLVKLRTNLSDAARPKS